MFIVSSPFFATLLPGIDATSHSTFVYGAAAKGGTVKKDLRSSAGDENERKGLDRKCINLEPISTECLVTGRSPELIRLP